MVAQKTRRALTLELPSDREIVVTYVISAPRQLVYDAYTKCEHLQHWLGPRGMSMPVCEQDLRPGGKWHFVHRDADGNEHGFHGEFREVVPPERLSRTFEYEGMPSHVSFETLTLAEQDGKTTLTNHVLFDSKEDRDGMIASGMEGGVTDSMERLGEYLEATADEFTLSHVCNAPRDLVWKAWTEPERLAQWWGPTGFEMLTCKLDLQPGGLFHYGMRSPEYGDMWGKFVFREIVAPERLVFVVSFSDENAGTTRHPMSATWPLEVLNIAMFEEHGGKTTITLRGGPINATAEERRTYSENHDSMRQGFGGTFEQLDAYLANAK